MLSCKIWHFLAVSKFWSEITGWWPLSSGLEKLEYGECSRKVEKWYLQFNATKKYSCHSNRPVNALVNGKMHNKFKWQSILDNYSSLPRNGVRKLSHSQIYILEQICWSIFILCMRTCKDLNVGEMLGRWFVIH